MARTPKNSKNKSQSLRQIQTRRRYLQESLALKMEERQVAFLEALDQWGADDWWSRSDPRQSNDIPRSNISVPSDRRGGDNWPLFRTEQELSRYRQDARIVCTTNTYAQGLLRNLRNYVIGKGFNYKAKSRRRVDVQPDKPGLQEADSITKLVRLVQDEIDRACAANDWNTGTACNDDDENMVAAQTREQEGFDRTRRDGEFYLRFFEPDEDDADGVIQVRFVEPERIKNPPGKGRDEGWTYGSRHKLTDGGGEDVETILEYHIASIDGEEGEYVPASEILHVKINVDRNIKRGLTDFRHGLLSALRRANTLQTNLSESSQVQAAVAEIQQWENATKTQLSEYAGGKMDYTAERPNASGGRTVNMERREPGAVRYLPKGVTFVPPPWSNGVASHQGVLQGDLRASATAYCAPEYLASGDASNANFSSTKEAGAPFTKNGETEQELYKGAYLKFAYRAVRFAIKCNRLPSDTLKLVEIQCEAPHVVTTNSLEVAQENQIYVSLGAKDRQTVCMQTGGDWELTRQNNLEYQEQFGQQGPPLTMPGDDKPKPGAGSPFAGFESLLETKDATGHEHAADGRFGSGGAKQGAKQGAKKKEPDHAEKASIPVTTKTPDDIAAESESHFKSLDDDTKKAVYGYTHKAYKDLNSAMRKCPPDFGCVTGPHKDLMERVEQAVSHELPKPVTVFRGIAVDDETSQAILKAAKTAMDNGGEMAMPSITSASFATNSESDFLGRASVVFQIKAKTGLAVDKFSANRGEHELIQSAKVKYKVAGVSQADHGGEKKHVVYLEER